METEAVTEAPAPTYAPVFYGFTEAHFRSRYTGSATHFASSTDRVALCGVTLHGKPTEVDFSKHGYVPQFGLCKRCERHEFFKANFVPQAAAAEKAARAEAAEIAAGQQAQRDAEAAARLERAQTIAKINSQLARIGIPIKIVPVLGAITAKPAADDITWQQVLSTIEGIDAF